MEDGDGEDTTPFWVQSAAKVRRGDRLRSLIFSSGLVIFLLMVTALCFLVFVVPSTLSFSSQQIFRPNSVKKSWDSLNTVLVLVAVVFGFLSRIKNEDRYSYYDESQQASSPLTKPNEITQKPNPPPPPPNPWYSYTTNEEQKPHITSTSSAPVQWYEYPDYQAKLEHKDPILERNGTSYPDLTEVSSTHWDYGRRFYDDDINVDMGRATDPDLGHLHRRHKSMGEVESMRAAQPQPQPQPQPHPPPPQNEPIFIDPSASSSEKSTILSPIHSPPPSPPTEPEAPPLHYNDKPRKRKNGKAARRKERLNRRSNKESNSVNPITDLEPDPPIPIPEPEESPEPEDQPKTEYQSGEANVEIKTTEELNQDAEFTNPITTTTAPSSPPPPDKPKTEKKRGGVTANATKDFLNSLYNNKKKKKNKRQQQSIDNNNNIDALIHQNEPPLSFQIPPKSPPTQPSVFQNLFSSKKHKRKRNISVSVAQTPLPPSNPNSEIAPPMSDQTPPELTHTSSFENPNSGGASPLNRIPSPPLPPPAAFLRNPPWKFVVQGDYVRINSANTSRSGSPERDDVEGGETPPPVAVQASPLFCPSPDVNTKAESFIINFRAKLKAEKNHSMRKRELGLSSLGPGPGPGPGPDPNQI